MNIFFQFFLLAVIFLTGKLVNGQVLVINELNSWNNQALKDENKDFSDWIELFNFEANPINLLGYMLSDDSLDLQKWIFPDVNILPGEYKAVWDSGKIEFEKSNNVNYTGLELYPAKRYWWKVKLWNSKGEEQNWSEVEWFEPGLFSKSDWKEAKWIGLAKDSRSDEFKSRPVKNRVMEQPRMETSHPSPLFRKEFSVSKKIRNARVYLSGLGYNELYVNGEKVRDAVLNPGRTSYDKRAFYDIYDVAPKLKTGKNVFGVMLGNGFYGQNMAFGVKFLDYGESVLKCLIRISYEDWSDDNIISDESWLSSSGPIVFDNVSAGETYDAKKEVENWCNAEGDVSGLEKSKILNDIEIPVLISQLIQPNKKGSHNHSMQSGFAVWFNQNVGGIQPDESFPEFKHFRIKPFGFHHLEFANASYKSIYGMISSDWKVQQNQFIHSIEIPVNTSATVFIPTSDPGSVKIEEKQFGSEMDIEFLGIEKGVAKYSLKSGLYLIKSNI